MDETLLIGAAIAGLVIAKSREASAAPTTAVSPPNTGAGVQIGRPATSGRDLAVGVGQTGGAIGGVAICTATGVGVAALPACAAGGALVGGVVVDYGYEPAKSAATWVGGKIRSWF